MTFALTVLADLTVAVEAGMILAALLFITRVAATTTVSNILPNVEVALRRAEEITSVTAGRDASALPRTSERK